MAGMEDLNTASMLGSQITQLNLAIDILSNGGRITQMQIASAEGVEPAQETPVDTSFMVYPPEMIDAIIAQMQQQVDKLSSQISGLGVTGIPPTPRAAATGRRKR